MDNLDDLLNGNGFTVVPAWLAAGIQSKNPRVTIGLANSMLYKVKPLDRVLGTLPLCENIKVEVN